MVKDRKEESQRYYEKNKDAINARRRARRKEDALLRQRQNESSRKWREKVDSDPEAKSEKNQKQREWYKNSDKTRICKYRKEYKLPETSKIKKKAWVAQRRAKHMAKLVELLGGECHICGLVDDPIVYDFHHIDPELKEFEISKWIASTSWSKIWKEAQKCALLCSICHRKLTHGKLKQPNGARQIEKKSKGGS